MSPVVPCDAPSLPASEVSRRPTIGTWQAINLVRRLHRSPLENDRESPLSSAHVVPIYLVGVRRSLVRTRILVRSVNEPCGEGQGRSQRISLAMPSGGDLAYRGLR